MSMSSQQFLIIFDMFAFQLGATATGGKKGFIDQYFGGEFSVTMKCIESEDEKPTQSSETFYQLSCFIEKEVKYLHTGLKNVSTYHNIDVSIIFSPPVLMHGGLLGIAFCLSVCLSICHYSKSHQKIIHQIKIHNLRTV